MPATGREHLRARREYTASQAQMPARKRPRPGRPASRRTPAAHGKLSHVHEAVDRRGYVFITRPRYESATDTRIPGFLAWYRVPLLPLMNCPQNGQFLFKGL